MSLSLKQRLQVVNCDVTFEFTGYAITINLRRGYSNKPVLDLIGDLKPKPFLDWLLQASFHRWLNILEYCPYDAPMAVEMPVIGVSRHIPPFLGRGKEGGIKH